MAPAENFTWDINDLDELGGEILRLWRADVLQGRDAEIRRLIGRLGMGPAGELPFMLPTADERRKAE